MSNNLSTIDEKLPPIRCHASSSSQFDSYSLVHITHSVDVYLKTNKALKENSTSRDFQLVCRWNVLHEMSCLLDRTHSLYQWIVVSFVIPEALFLISTSLTALALTKEERMNIPMHCQENICFVRFGRTFRRPLPVVKRVLCLSLLSWTVFFPLIAFLFPRVISQSQRRKTDLMPEWWESNSRILWLQDTFSHSSCCPFDQRREKRISSFSPLYLFYRDLNFTAWLPLSLSISRFSVFLSFLFHSILSWQWFGDCFLSVTLILRSDLQKDSQEKPNLNKNNCTTTTTRRKGERYSDWKTSLTSRQTSVTRVTKETGNLINEIRFPFSILYLLCFLQKVSFFWQQNVSLLLPSEKSRDLFFDNIKSQKERKSRNEEDFFDGFVFVVSVVILEAWLWNLVFQKRKRVKPETEIAKTKRNCPREGKNEMKRWECSSGFDGRKRQSFLVMMTQRMSSVFEDEIQHETDQRVSVVFCVSVLLDVSSL